MLHTLWCFIFRRPFSNNFSAFLWTQCNTSEFHTFRCSVWSKSFGIFTNLMKHFRVYSKNRFHSFNILGVLMHRFFFVLLPSQTLLKPYHLRCSVCTKLFSSFIKLYKHFRIHYENCFSSCNFFSFLYFFDGSKSAFNGFGAP